jgi:hypothetical protein
MSSKSSEEEWLRGLKESAAGIEVLRSFWPKAFPQQAHLVRPLVSGLAGRLQNARVGVCATRAASCAGGNCAAPIARRCFTMSAAGISKVRKSPTPLSRMQRGSWPANSWRG